MSNILASRRVLIVDDVKAMRLIVRSLLRACGIEHITEASDGESALDVLRLTHTDLVIADRLMQPMDGLEMTRRLRRRQTSINPAIPILMVSGKMDAASVKSGIDAGVTDFLVKPLSPAVFRHRIEAIFEKPRETIKTQHYYGPNRRRRMLRTLAERRAREADIFEV